MQTTYVDTRSLRVVVNHLTDALRLMAAELERLEAAQVEPLPYPDLPLRQRQCLLAFDRAPKDRGLTLAECHRTTNAQAPIARSSVQTALFALVREGYLVRDGVRFLRADKA